MHGNHTVVEEMLDWRPPDYFTVGITLPIPGAPRIVMTRAVLDGPSGMTHLELRVAKPKPKDREFVDGAAVKYAERMTKAIAGLRSMLEGKQPALDAVEEPALTRSSGRFLTEPVKSGARG
ncbi:hypothetical protein ACVIWU_003088 [Bradyrhizobium sp. USDA 4509]